ncbi:hypothetical protein E1176_06035, partial [Fulvivirga sp. RKSG066]|uniref:hypothetical protein n=1 Tax=Fulvivirga aurantia TaxID=2529383 RepID=UPI0012BD8046
MEKEERNKKLGLVISGAFHLLLLLAFLFIIAWKEPDPPIPEYGIELNFGTSDVGTGNVQPETAVEETPVDEEAAPEELPEESTEDVVEEVDVTEEVEDTPTEAAETTENTQASPDVVEETPKVEKQPEVKEVKKETKPVEKPTEEKKTEKPAAGAKGNEGENNKPQNANQGDNIDKQGDKGDEQGTLDSRALYGQAGGGGGPALSIVGWIWDEVPNKKDDSSENGQIIIDFWIDDQGEVLRTRITETGVSMAVAKFYEEQLREI